MPESLVPQPLVDDSWLQIKAGEGTMCGLTVRGALRCWGLWYMETPFPEHIQEWRAVGLHGRHGCGITKHGEGYCWGESVPMPGLETRRWRELHPAARSVCGITEEGEAICYGGGLDGRTAIPVSPSGWQFIAMGGRHGCGVTGAKELRCWGIDTERQSSPPAIEGEWASLSCDTFSCGVLTTGQVHCWGFEYESFIRSPATDLPWQSIAGHFRAVCGLAGDDLLCWGSGMLTPPALPPGDAWDAVSPGMYHVCALTKAGNITCWGDGLSGELSPPQVPGRWVAVSSGDRFTCGLKDDGAAICWGGISKVNVWGKAMKSLSTSRMGACGITVEDTILCYGKEAGQLQPPVVAAPWTDVSCGFQSICGISGGNIYCWGDAKITGIPPGPWVSLRVADVHACALSSDGAAACFGKFEGVPDLPPQRHWVAVQPAWRHTCGIDSVGDLHCWMDLTSPPPPPPVYSIRFAHIAGLSVSELGVCGYQYLAQRSYCFAFTGAFGFDQPSEFDAYGLTDNGMFVLNPRAGDNLRFEPKTGQTYTTPSIGTNLQLMHTISSDRFCAVSHNMPTGSAILCLQISTNLEYNNLDVYVPPPLGQVIGYDMDKDSVCVIMASMRLWCDGSIKEVGPYPATAAQVSITDSFGCVVALNGTLGCWGTVPPSIQSGLPHHDGFKNVSVSSTLVCALTREYTVVCFGEATRQARILPYLGGPGWVELFVGDRFVCACNVNGQLICPDAPPFAGEHPQVAPSASIPVAAIGLSDGVSACNPSQACITPFSSTLPHHRALLLLSDVTIPAPPFTLSVSYLGPRLTGPFDVTTPAIHCGSTMGPAPTPCMNVSQLQMPVVLASLRVTGRGRVALEARSVPMLRLINTHWLLTNVGPFTPSPCIFRGYPRCVPHQQPLVFRGTGDGCGWRHRGFRR